LQFKQRGAKALPLSGSSSASHAAYAQAAWLEYMFRDNDRRLEGWTA